MKKKLKKKNFLIQHPLVILALCKRVGNCIATDFFTWLLDHGLLAIRTVAYLLYYCIYLGAN